jgi:hypothetical protein
LSVIQRNNLQIFVDENDETPCLKLDSRQPKTAQGNELSGKTLFFCFFNGLPAQFIRLDCKANQDTMTNMSFDKAFKLICQSSSNFCTQKSVILLEEIS